MQFLKLSYDLITDKNITANEFRIYTYLLSLYNSEKNCSYPSLEVISKNLGICLSTVKKSIKRLEKLGYIKIEKRKGLAGNFNIYKNLKHIINTNKKTTKKSIKTKEIVKKLKDKLSDKDKKVNNENEENDANNIDITKNNKSENIENKHNKNNIDSHINVSLARAVTNVDNSNFAKKILSLANENIVREAIKIFKKKRGKTPTFLISLMIDEYCRKQINFPKSIFNLLKGTSNKYLPTFYF